MEKTIGGREGRGGDHVLMSARDASDARGPLHGFDLSAEEESLLRGPVPERALRWAAAAIGAGARVRVSEALEGGTSSAVHGLRVQAGDGRVHELVLRRFVREAGWPRSPTWPRARRWRCNWSPIATSRRRGWWPWTSTEVWLVCRRC